MGEFKLHIKNNKRYLNGGKQSLKVHIDDIRVNPNNDYEINEDEVISLSLSIEKYGQLHNGVVYEDEGEDGKNYTLISGEKRYRAIKLLFQEFMVQVPQD